MFWFKKIFSIIHIVDIFASLSVNAWVFDQKVVRTIHTADNVEIDISGFLSAYRLPPIEDHIIPLAAGNQHPLDYQLSRKDQSPIPSIDNRTDRPSR